MARARPHVARAERANTMPLIRTGPNGRTPAARARERERERMKREREREREKEREREREGGGG